MEMNNALTYEKLESAVQDRYVFSDGNAIPYPGTESVEWYGYRRHNFELEGRKGFIVEPPHPAPGLPWSWCLHWAEAFVPRTPALQLLERGFHHVHFDVFSTYMNEEGVALLEKFYAMLQGLHFHKKAALIGMSYGGLFSLRWAASHPETVGAMYLDAPVCTITFASERNEHNEKPEKVATWQREAQGHMKAYRVDSHEGLLHHPLNPINNYMPIVEAQIPTLLIRSGQDTTVLPETNTDVLAQRMTDHGMKNLFVVKRGGYGHHPHGLDDPTPLADFILRHYPEV